MLAAIFVVGALAAAPIFADTPSGLGGLPAGLPQEFRNVGITEHRSDSLPLGLQFQDERGEFVSLGKYFQNKRPVILQLGYFDCPMLCDVVSHGVIESVRDVNLKAGTDFDFVFVSINPAETSDQAALKKEHYIQQYAKEGEQGGFHFLVGNDKNIHALADGVGFRYSWVPSVKQFAHAAVILVITPDGRISRYLYGVTFPSQTLRLSLVEASDGKIGQAMDQILLFCLHYDAVTGKYAIAALRLMQVSCVFTALMLGGTLFWFHRREALQRLREAALPAKDGADKG